VRAVIAARVGKESAKCPLAAGQEAEKNPQSGTAREMPLPCDLPVYLPCFFNNLRAGMRQAAVSCSLEGAGNNTSSTPVRKTFPTFFQQGASVSRGRVLSPQSATPSGHSKTTPHAHRQDGKRPRICERWNAKLLHI